MMSALFRVVRWSGLVGALLVAAVVAVAVTASAFTPPPSHDSDGWLDRLDALASELDLTDAQRTTVEQILVDAHTRGAGLHTEHDQLRDEAIALLTADPIDRAALEAVRQRG